MGIVCGGKKLGKLRVWEIELQEAERSACVRGRGVLGRGREEHEEHEENADF